ncbi:hypothetical protein [Microvirga massiliensis]|uniref:hypothetical protein n=1 Tax=Microvirga massiliensis TaxID=1033741 RepID=UPI00062BDF30|nr:hypothetical protein [Microvirga massiliensis]
MSNTALIVAGIVAGLATLVGLWFVSPIFCLLCAPLVASFVIGLAAMVGSWPPKRSRRHGLAGYSPVKLQ